MREVKAAREREQDHARETIETLKMKLQKEKLQELSVSIIYEYCHLVYWMQQINIFTVVGPSRTYAQRFQVKDEGVPKEARGRKEEFRKGVGQGKTAVERTEKINGERGISLYISSVELQCSSEPHVFLHENSDSETSGAVSRGREEKASAGDTCEEQPAKGGEEKPSRCPGC